MKHSILTFLATSALVISLTASASAGTDGKAVAPVPPPETLFPSQQFSISLFGESANGRIDVDPGQSIEHGSRDIKVPFRITTFTGPHAAAEPGGGIEIGGAVPFAKSGVRGANQAAAFAARDARPAAVPTFRSSSTQVILLPNGDTKTVTTGFIHGSEKTRRIVSNNHVEHHAGGGGVELSWFFTRYTGIAVEGDFLGGDPYVTAVTGQFIVRYPFEFGRKPITGYSKDAKDVRSAKDSKDYKSLAMSGPTWGIAPYLLCGGGGQWDGRGEAIADVGGGVELRFKDHYGVYCDGRWTVHDADQNYAAVRLGFAYNF